VAGPVGAPDEIERDDLLADQATVHSRSTFALVVMGKGGAHLAANQEDPGSGDDDRGRDLHSDGTGEHEGHSRTGKAAHRGEKRVERKVAKLDGDQHHANDDPRNGQRDPFSSGAESTTAPPLANGGRDVSASGNDGAVKRSTAIGHLVEMAEVATERLRLRDTDIGWPLEQLWVTGDLLGLADTLEAGAVVLVLDLPAEELPWLALNPAGEWVGDQLRLGKRPLQWCYRPLTWPVWNHDHRRLARFWSAADGLDATVIEALRSLSPIGWQSSNRPSTSSQRSYATSSQCLADTSRGFSTRPRIATGGAATTATTNRPRTTCGEQPPR
jgi:hypothetical protein